MAQKKRRSIKTKPKKRKRKLSVEPSYVPAPIELIRFCEEVGISLFKDNPYFGLAPLHGSEDSKDPGAKEATDQYNDIVEQFQLGPGRMQERFDDKLRQALRLWRLAHEAVARVLSEAQTPIGLERHDSRIQFRWRRSRKPPLQIRPSMDDDVRFRWEEDCVSEPITPEARIMTVLDEWYEERKVAREKRNLPSKKRTLTTLQKFRNAAHAFGCPTELEEKLSRRAIRKTAFLDEVYTTELAAIRQSKKRASN